jgi:hypothetical protein
VCASQYAAWEANSLSRSICASRAGVLILPLVRRPALVLEQVRKRRVRIEGAMVRDEVVGVG